MQLDTLPLPNPSFGDSTSISETATSVLLLGGVYQDTTTGIALRERKFTIDLTSSEDIIPLAADMIGRLVTFTDVDGTIYTAILGPVSCSYDGRALVRASVELIILSKLGYLLLEEGGYLLLEEGGRITL